MITKKYHPVPSARQKKSESLHHDFIIHWMKKKPQSFLNGHDNTNIQVTNQTLMIGSGKEGHTD
ncbi:hypothetical protein DMA11_19205 [Marinilabiliaceae bacterium JC017]|nr:hypothetical protein DMA11_19205 [Marinilabiliaceae bacterium JC017]